MLAELIEDIKARDEHDYNVESPTKAADAKETTLIILVLMKC